MFLVDNYKRRPDLKKCLFVCFFQNAEIKVEEAAKESPKAARLTQQSSEDNEVFGELLRQL